MPPGDYYPHHIHLTESIDLQLVQVCRRTPRSLFLHTQVRYLFVRRAPPAVVVESPLSRPRAPSQRG